MYNSRIGGNQLTLKTRELDKIKRKLPKKYRMFYEMT